MLMMLAFLIDQVQEYGCAFSKLLGSVFIRAPRCGSKSKDFFTEFFIESWEALWRAIIYGHGGGAFQPNTS
ncbi:MAG: hypothetical protein IPL59_26985 [Candidatus Competibacteraceae bacterium]|nr:hypothetical protein [Candidatus Competibacteraceae bacterium]